MKRCPQCRRDYYDDSLMYCLDDGAALLEGREAVAKGAGFLGAAGGVVFGIEIEDDIFAFDFGERDFATTAGGGGKIRGDVAFLQFDVGFEHGLIC